MTRTQFWKKMNEKYTDLTKNNDEVYENDEYIIRAAGTKKSLNEQLKSFTSFGIDFKDSAKILDGYHYMLIKKD